MLKLSENPIFLIEYFTLEQLSRYVFMIE